MLGIRWPLAPRLKHAGASFAEMTVELNSESASKQRNRKKSRHIDTDWDTRCQEQRLRFVDPELKQVAGGPFTSKTQTRWRIVSCRQPGVRKLNSGKKRHLFAWPQFPDRRTARAGSPEQPSQRADDDLIGPLNLVRELNAKFVFPVLEGIPLPHIEGCPFEMRNGRVGRH